MLDSKTLLLMLLGGGIAAYLAYSLQSSKAAPSTTVSSDLDASEGGFDNSDSGSGLPGFGLGQLPPDVLCKVAPSLCISDKVLWV